MDKISARESIVQCISKRMPIDQKSSKRPITQQEKAGKPNPCRVFNNSLRSIIWDYSRFKSDLTVGDVLSSVITVLKMHRLFLLRTLFQIRIVYVKYIDNKIILINEHFLWLNQKISLWVRHKKRSLTNDTLTSCGSR